jgi:hypothetical protein
VIATEDSTPPAPDAAQAVHGGTVVLAWVAIAFGIAAVPGGLFFLGLPADSPLYGLMITAAGVAPVAAMISWLLALVAASISGIRLIRPPRSRESRKAFAMAAPGAVLGTVAMGLVIYFVGGMLGLTQANEAEKSGERAVDHYLEQGATLVCDNGDNGHGPNRFPWYEAYLEVPASLGSEAEARDAIAKAGYLGTRRTDVPESFDLPSQSGAFALESLDEQEPLYEGDTVSPHATVQVLPWGQVTEWCSLKDDSWADGVSQKNGTLLVAIHVLLDSTR